MVIGFGRDRQAACRWCSQPAIHILISLEADYRGNQRVMMVIPLF